MESTYLIVGPENGIALMPCALTGLMFDGSGAVHAVLHATHGMPFVTAPVAVFRCDTTAIALATAARWRTVARVAGFRASKSEWGDGVEYIGAAAQPLQIVN